MKDESGGFWEWIIPMAFIVCASWVIWHIPAFILDLLPPSNESLFGKIAALHERKDVTPNMPALMGGYTDAVDWAALILSPIVFYLGVKTIRLAPMEFQEYRRIDKIAMFVGRITMMLIFSMTCVMLYEVFLRYAVEKPTLWANELTLWIAGFVFLLSGLYAMQQRCHIRIFLLYDVVPRWMQHVFDTIWVFLLAVFAFFMVFGSYKQVFVTKFYKWEMFGTAFDPPIPATIQPMILIMIVLIAIQAVLNLIADWDKEPVVHTAADDIDEHELAAMKRSAGVE